MTYNPMNDTSTSLSANKPPASIALDSLGIPHRVFRHEKPVSSFEEAALARNQRPEQIVRSILFQVRPGDFVLVLMAGLKNVSAPEQDAGTSSSP